MIYRGLQGDKGKGRHSNRPLVFKNANKREMENLLITTQGKNTKENGISK